MFCIIVYELNIIFMKLIILLGHAKITTVNSIEIPEMSWTCTLS